SRSGGAPPRCCPCAATSPAWSTPAGSTRCRGSSRKAPARLQRSRGAAGGRGGAGARSSRNTGPRPPAATAAPRAPIAPADRLRVRADGDVYVQSVEGGAKLLVAIGQKPGMEVTGVAMRLVQQALSAREVVAGDCLASCAPLAWAEVEQMLA